MENKEEIKKALSDIYVTLLDIEIKGKQAVQYALCLQGLEKVIAEIQINK